MEYIHKPSGGGSARARCPKPERTPGNHRRYRTIPKAVKALTVGYVRVSSHDQKEDLERQKAAVKSQAGKPVDLIISDLGSGLNYKKAGFRQRKNRTWNSSALIWSGSNPSRGNYNSRVEDARKQSNLALLQGAGVKPEECAPLLGTLASNVLFDFFAAKYEELVKMPTKSYVDLLLKSAKLELLYQLFRESYSHLPHPNQKLPPYLQTVAQYHGPYYQIENCDAAQMVSPLYAGLVELFKLMEAQTGVRAGFDAEGIILSLATPQTPSDPPPFSPSSKKPRRRKAQPKTH